MKEVQKHLLSDCFSSNSDKKAIIEHHAKFEGEYIEKRGYVGHHCNVRSRVIGELAVVHEYARLGPNTEVRPTEIYIRTPTSLILYGHSDRNVSSEEYVFYDFLV